MPVRDYECFGDARDAFSAVTAPAATIYSVKTMNQLVDEILYPRRLAAGILAVAGRPCSCP